MPTVSIALCTFNGASFLSHQLDSLASQTLLPDEIIICDDASSDNSLQIANSFASKVSIPVQIHQNKKNLGYVKNFENAISRCTQDLIFCATKTISGILKKSHKSLPLSMQSPM
jgi:glycosyltransferase involved in cell wall biosynthesis